jgi:hypothetical protein
MKHEAIKTEEMNCLGMEVVMERELSLRNWANGIAAL